MSIKANLKKRLAPLEKSIVIEVIWLGWKYRKFQKKNKHYASLSWQSAKAVGLVKNRLKISRLDNSFANEFLTAKSILDNIVLQNNYLVDIGAADGIHQSSTSKFLDMYKWSGTLFEYDSDSFAKLAFLYNDRTDVNLGKVKVNPISVSGLLHGFHVPKEFDYLNLDIDSYDLSVLRAILEANFRPGLISLEINEIFPPNVKFEVLYDSEFRWNHDKFYGCSLRAAKEVLDQYNYLLTRVEYNNAFFIHASRANENSEQPNIYSAYKEGYIDRQERFELFPWNKGIEIESGLDVDKVTEIVQEMFEGYSGKYFLEVLNE